MIRRCLEDKAPTYLSDHCIPVTAVSSRHNINWLYCAAVTLARPSLSSSLQDNRSFTNSQIHHLTCGISFLLHSVSRILFTLLLVHLILRISPHHSHHLRSHHISLPGLSLRTQNSFLSQIVSSIVTLIPSALPSRILNLYRTKCAMKFVCFSFFFLYFCGFVRARLSWTHSAFESASNSFIVPYRMSRCF